nr:neuroblastoma-amplified sequence-like [Vanessa tameamea]
MTESKSILHELYVFSEWKPEPEYLQKPDNLLPENISSLWRWFKFFGPKKSLIDSVTAHNERQQKWQIALGDEGKVIAVLTDSILEIRTKRSEYATIAARTTVSRDAYAQWRKVVWSPDCSFLVVAYGNGVVSFFDLTASNLFNIPADCSRPGGLECTDNTHAVSDIIFMPLRVKDTKWNWEVLVVTYDGKLRGYLVSQTEGYKLHHVFQFSGGVAAAVYCEPHNTLYVAGLPRPARDEPESASGAGLTAWRVLNDEPFYKLSVVSDELEARLANERFQLYWPLVFNTNSDFIVRMSASPERGRLVCVHCSGAISVWSAPALRAQRRFVLAEQPQHALASPLPAPAPASAPAPAPAPPPTRPAHVAWWSDEEIIVSRFNGSVTVCELQELNNILGKKPEFFQGTPQITCAHDGVFMVLECESNIMPAKKSRSDESMEVVPADEEVDDSMLEVAKELLKSVLYAITDIETFQPKPKKITVVSRIYRLLGVKSTTPMELFSRKIESGNYTEALSLAETFDLDSDLVYQQHWRKNPVSTDAIHNYLSKVRKKIWAVHQCVDRLPESLPAANELLHFGLQLTNQKILEEINKDLPEERWVGPAGVTLEALNAYTSELLRCRHVMLFYKERLALYEAILRCEKSTYVKDEYDRLRSNSIVHSAMEIAKEGRIEALTCLWPYIKSLDMQLTVLDKIPETLCPLTYQHLLPTNEPLEWFEKKSPIKIKPFEHENDWCRNEIFRPIWSSNWSSDKTPEGAAAGAAAGAEAGAGAGAEAGAAAGALTQWYERRARAIERRSGLASHALRLLAAAQAGAVPGLERALFLLRTLDTLLYDLNVEGVSLDDLENMPNLEICKLLMKMSTRETFIADLKQFLVPFLKRYQDLTRFPGACLSGLIEFLEDISKEDLSYILLVITALRHAPAAPLLARTAQHAHAHADTPERSRLLAAALAHAPRSELHDMIHARLNLQLESLQQMGAALRDNHRLDARWSSTEDEFADAITTPVIEKKDLVSSTLTEKQVPLINFLLDTVQNKFSSSSGKPVSSDATERTVHCQEFYRSLYPEHDVSSNYYCYDRFAVPDDLDGEASIGQSVLKWFYIQNSLEEGAMGELETDVTQKCAEELLYRDTALSVAAALRVPGGLRAPPARAAACAALYAALVAANAPALRDHAYLAAPPQLAHITLKKKNASKEQMEIIRQCIDKLSGMGEVERIRALGLSVNGLLFNTDKDYRREVIYHLAKSVGAEQVRLSCALADKYQLDALDVWLHAACAAPARAAACPAPRAPLAPQRIREKLWPVIEGNDYVALLNFFTVLKNMEDKTLMYGLTAVEHIKLLKKAKAASPDLDYKLLLDQPSADQFTEHILSITKPENVGLLMKFLRTLPPACKLPLPVNSLFTMWLTKYFFSVGASGASKKWMQQWRQCASYFTKLPKDELLQFVAATCFSSDALLRVPAGTRNLMIMQAVDYCQQEQENDFKFNKNEQSWAQVGQELSRWARFLENYHSDSVQAIVAASELPRDQVWPDLEKSHGDTEEVVDALARLVLHGGLRPAHLSSLLQLLRVPAETADVFQRLLRSCEHSLDDTAALAARVGQYHRAGAALGERVLQAAAQQAARVGLPPQQQLGLLSLGRRAQPAADLRQVALSTLQLFRAEWPDRACARLDEESLLTPEGRQEAYNELVNSCDSWQRKKALVDVLACWPPTHSDGRSLHCDYLYRLLSQSADVKESLVLIKLLLTRPVLEDEEIKWLTENAGSNSLINTIWVILLSKSEISEDLLRNLVLEHKDSIQKEEIEEDLIKEILDQGMFIKLVSTPLYSSIINYIMNADSSGVDTSNTYTIQWATAELMKANYLAEAGNLQLLSAGVPSVLRGFSQAVLYYNNTPQQ